MKLLLTMLLSVVHAATTATLTITGTVNPILYIGFDVAGSTTVNTLTLTSSQLLTGFTNVSAGTMYEVTNDASHNYNITVTSTNAGKLKHSTVATSVVAYTMTYGSLFTNSSLSSPVSNVVNTSAYTSSTTNNRAIGVSSGGNANALAGVYSDTITFTVSSI